MESNLSEIFFPNFTNFVSRNETFSVVVLNDTFELHDLISMDVPMEDKIIYAFLVLLGLLIIAANLQVLVLAVKFRFLRKKTNYIIISLAVSDLLSGALAIPLLVACSSVAEYSLTLWVGMDICQRFLAISTILHLVVAVLNRYFRIVRPFLYRRVVTVFRLGMIIMCLWAISLTTAFIQIAWLHEKQESRISFIYDSAVLVVLVLVPFLAIIAACARTFGVIKQSRKHHGKEELRSCKLKKSQRKALTLYCIMTTCFAIGWFPYFVLSITEDLEIEIELPYWLSILFLFLKYGTSLADPLLYTFLKSDFQASIRYIRRGKTRDTRSQVSQFVSQSSGTSERNNTLKLPSPMRLRSTILHDSQFATKIYSSSHKSFV
ncbi:5-hydroxytryptamine receptor-like [Actinia tenebrosa]|uniref:5-hydroxytryptamine receptor-like n=1 Tax=Actinia tenebrosa TaxID=6105 RepID=A0A6P8I1Z2_ACTTE|nr:5-hydroxytryptamine receptor-like [Actinia tenebrosa]